MAHTWATLPGAAPCSSLLPRWCSSHGVAPDRIPRPVRDRPYYSHAGESRSGMPSASTSMLTIHRCAGCISMPCTALTSPIARCTRMLQAAARARPASLGRSIWSSSTRSKARLQRTERPLSTISTRRLYAWLADARHGSGTQIHMWLNVAYRCSQRRRAHLSSAGLSRAAVLGRCSPVSVGYTACEHPSVSGALVVTSVPSHFTTRTHTEARLWDSCGSPALLGSSG